MLAYDFSNKAGTTPLAYVTAPGAYFDEDDSLGIGIYSTIPGNDYGFKRGTSMATPNVAGVVALMLSAKKGLTNAQVRQIVTSTAANGVKPSSSSLSANSTSGSNAAISSLSASSKSSSTTSLSRSIYNYTTASKVAISNWNLSSSKQSDTVTHESYHTFVNNALWSESVRYQSTNISQNSLVTEPSDTDTKTITKKRKNLPDEYQNWLLNLGIKTI